MMNRQMTAQEAVEYIQGVQVQIGTKLGNVLNRLEKVETELSSLKKEGKLINVSGDKLS